MSTLAQKKMTVDEFLAWAEGQEGRWELLNGVPYRMAPERTGHIEVKYAVYLALRQAIRKAGLSCHVLGDGAGVSALARFDKDVLMQTGVTHVVVMEGINDIGLARSNPSPSAADNTPNANRRESSRASP